MKKIAAIPLILIVLSACQKPVVKVEGPETAADKRDSPETLSLLGKPLYSMSFSEEREAGLRADLEQAKFSFEQSPKDPENIIWLGRRTAYLTRYRQSIEIYTKGIKQHPDNAKFYRHRGHRYVSVREFDRAIADLEKAAELTQDMEDEIEPDGQPNQYNKPRSTLKSNIWYHLGLAYYLKGDFERALNAYLECMKYSTWNDDMLCATSDWLYMTYRRLGRDEDARKVLEPIHSGMEILENSSYHKRLLMYKGIESPESLLGAQSEDALQIATQGYGVGNWFFYNGQVQKARQVFKKVIEGSYWPAFGYIAAEAELARMQAN